MAELSKIERAAVSGLDSRGRELQRFMEDLRQEGEDLIQELNEKYGVRIRETHYVENGHILPIQAAPSAPAEPADEATPGAETKKED